MLRYKTELAWFSRLVRHPARKRSGSILTTPSPHRAPLFKGSDVPTKCTEVQWQDFYWCMGAVLAGCRFCQHRRLMQVPAAIEPRFTGIQSATLTTELRLLLGVPHFFKTNALQYKHYCHQHQQKQQQVNLYI